MAFAAYMDSALSILGFIASLVLFIPSLAVEVRRLHDIGKSGWYVLIRLVPLVGIVLLLIWLFSEGDPDNNQFGPSPK